VTWTSDAVRGRGAEAPGAGKPLPGRPARTFLIRCLRADGPSHRVVAFDPPLFEPRSALVAAGPESLVVSVRVGDDLVLAALGAAASVEVHRPRIP